MKKKLFFIGMLLLVWISLPALCEEKYLVIDTFSVQQIEPMEDSSETSQRQITYIVRGDSLSKCVTLDGHDSFSVFRVENSEKKSVSLYLEREGRSEKEYTISFAGDKKVIVNGIDTYLLEDESYERLYRDLEINGSIRSVFAFLSCCPYYYLDSNLQDLPFELYDAEYEIVHGKLGIKSIDSELILPHKVEYLYEENGDFSVICKCDDPDFIGLSYSVRSEEKAEGKRVTNSDISFFEKRYESYGTIFDYERKTVRSCGKIIHSYFTDSFVDEYETIQY